MGISIIFAMDINKILEDARAGIGASQSAIESGSQAVSQVISQSIASGLNLAEQGINLSSESAAWAMDQGQAREFTMPSHALHPDVILSSRPLLTRVCSTIKRLRASPSLLQLKPSTSPLTTPTSPTPSEERQLSCCSPSHDVSCIEQRLGISGVQRLLLGAVRAG